MEKGRRRMATSDMVGTSNLWVCIFFFFKSKFDIDQNVHFSRNWPELDGMAGTSLNWPEFDPRWNGWYYRTRLHADTRYFGHSG